MNEVIIKENKKIKNRIYEVRGKQVMLDYDSSKLYMCKNGTKDINKAVKRNINKFPERFSWILTTGEIKDLLSKILSSKNISNKSRVNTRIFTEQGVDVLATILKSDIAVQVIINIMDAFVIIRKYISNELMISNTINSKLLE